MEVKLRTVGNSLSMTIPHSIAEILHLHSGDVVNVSNDNGEVIAKPVNNKSLEDMFREYNDSRISNDNYSPNETDWGSPIGKEIW